MKRFSLASALKVRAMIEDAAKASVGQATGELSAAQRDLTQAISWRNEHRFHGGSGQELLAQAMRADSLEANVKFRAGKSREAFEVLLEAKHELTEATRGVEPLRRLEERFIERVKHEELHEEQKFLDDLGTQRAARTRKEAL